MEALDWIATSMLAGALKASATLYLFVNAAHILSIGALRTRINDLGIARPLEVKRELQRRSGQRGAAVLADLTAAGTARRHRSRAPLQSSQRRE